MLHRLVRAPIEIRSPAELVDAAWDVADDLGWAKTYDAHYVALAKLERCRLVTLDERLIRGTARFGTVVRPSEL
jgi:predicted nucleic acid-binding protein